MSKNLKIAKSRVTELTAQDWFRVALTKGYPMAIWRLPNSEASHAVIQVEHEEDSSLDELENAPTGFLVNAFENHHPATPKLIRGDITISWNGDQVERGHVEISPVISDDQIDRIKDDKKVKLPTKDVSPSHPDFEQIVTRAISEINRGTFSKVVLSRFEDERLPEGFDLIRFFLHCGETYKNAFTYIVSTNEDGVWLGATPETLLSFDNKGVFKTVSLAGTQRLDDKSLADIAWTQKEIEEQAMVSRYVIDCFKKIRLREYEENGPKTVKAGNLAHLKTEYAVHTEGLAIDDLSSIMMHLLHPTSAVCGMPLQPALNFIKEVEGYERGLYAGFLGPVNFNNLTHLFVNLRCMQIINDQKIRLYAGAGITADSDPNKEFVETQLKMNTLKNLLFK